MKIGWHSRKDRGSDSNDSSPARRRFLTRLWAVLGGLALVELTVVGAAFLGLRKRHPDRGSGDATTIVMCGEVDRYKPGTVTPFVRGRFYLTRLEDGGFLAVSRRCTHLGCTVPWEAEAKQYVCPCHASVFDITGQVIHAPAPRALDLYTLSIENNIISVNIRQPIRRRGFERAQLVYAQKS